MRPEGSVAATGFAAGINPPEMPGVHVRNSQGVMDYACNAESTSHAHVFLVTSKIIDFGFPEFLAGFVDFGISRRVSAVFVRPKNVRVFQGGRVVEESFFVIGESVPVNSFGANDFDARGIEGGAKVVADPTCQFIGFVVVVAGAVGLVLRRNCI